MKIRHSLFLLFLLLLTSCNSDDPDAIQDESRQFLNEVLFVMEQNSINKYTIDWTDFRTKVFEKVRGAQTISDTYPGIREALTLLGDNHSSFARAGDGTFIFVSDLECDAEAVVTPSLPDDIGYVSVGPFSGSSNSVEARAFAQDIQSQIAMKDNAQLKGWIVDLRGNLGGNMWPMLLGVGPILGEGTAGYFIDADNNQTSWGVSDGIPVVNGVPVITLSNAYQLEVPNPKVAVLLDNAVVSSGEVMAISFIGRENTRSFGTSTCGLSTSNQTFSFSFNASLSLTTAVLADRNQNKYGTAVFPDEVVANEDIIANAVAWLEE